jgi:peptidoglycan/xylan/chitin deacetylase (PgdA/CDA1 family)
MGCQFLGINLLFYFLNRNRKRILCYHNVLPEGHFQDRLHEGVSHSEFVFQQQVRHLAKRFPMGLDLENPRQLTLSFDDGYRNQHAIVHPILMQYGIRAYFFCALDLVLGNCTLLIDEIMLWLSYTAEGEYNIRLPGLLRSMTLNIRSEADRLSCYQTVYSQIAADYHNIAPAVRAEFDRCRPFSEIRSWIEPDYQTLRFSPILPHALDAMKAYGHQVGAHSMTHAVMSSLNEDDMNQEYEACSRELGKLFNCAVFSYPYGGLREVSLRETEATRNHGFTDAVSNTNTPLPGNRTYTRYFRPRMALPNTSDVAVIDFILSGAKHFMQHCRLLPKLQP